MRSRAARRHAAARTAAAAAARALAAACVAGGLLAGHAQAASAQIRLENLSLSMGLATEAYAGNFSAITVPQIDSTESALAGAGDMGARGTLILLAQDNRSLGIDFDAGLRQFYTTGFQLRNYAPREISANAEATFYQQVGSGRVTAGANFASRHIADRPPMPLYLPPGYNSGAAHAEYVRDIGPSLSAYGRIAGQVRDFAAPSVLPALDLLDRRSGTITAGVTRSFPGRPNTLDRSTLTLFGAYQRHSYPKQGLGLLRTDNGLQLGTQWMVDRLETRGFLFSVQIHGTRSRSNSSRVEYNAGRIEADAVVDLGDATQLDLYGLWGAKRYINPQDALVPGEEADNAASVSAEVARFLGSGVRAGIGGGWTRAETNISGAYYQRFSLSFSLTVNPRM